MDQKLTICCFLWGDWWTPYGIQYVNRLYNSVQRHLTLLYDFICITDKLVSLGFSDGIRRIFLDVPDLKWNLKKMFLYKPDNGLSGRIICFDLDVVIIGSLNEIASYDGEFITCEAVYHPGRPGGSVIGFQAGFGAEELWKPLMQDQQKWEKETKGSERAYFRKRLNGEYDFWQNLYPGQILSYKRSCGNGLPNDVRVVRFHGMPRPHEVEDQWVKENWR